MNEQIVNEDYIVKAHDVVGHTTHRHEPPVTNQLIRIIHQDDDILVIEKPPSIPIHPTYAL